VLLGAGRTGTTLVSEILFRHRDLGFPSNYNEKFPLFPRISLIRNVFDNRFWRVFGIKVQELNNASFFNKILFTPSEAWSMWDFITELGDDFSRGFLLGKTANEDTKKNILKYLHTVLVCQNKSRLAFKLTGPARLEYLSSIFIKPVFINIVRNPVPMISSFMKSNFWQRQGMKELWWKGAYSDNELELININKNNKIWFTSYQLKKVIETTNEELNISKDQNFEIKYEDFVKDPQEWLHYILNSVNLDIDKECFNYIKRHNIVSNERPDSKYFSNKELELIYTIFN
jgi:hypothetical protein